MRYVAKKKMILFLCLFGATFVDEIRTNQEEPSESCMRRCWTGSIECLIVCCCGLRADSPVVSHLPVNGSPTENYLGTRAPSLSSLRLDHDGSMEWVSSGTSSSSSPRLNHAVHVQEASSVPETVFPVQNS